MLEVQGGSQVDYLFCSIYFLFSCVNVEQLNRIEKNMDDMNSEMKQAEKHITGMEKWCGLFVCPWNRLALNHFFNLNLCLISNLVRTRKVKDTDGTWKAPKEDKKSGKGAVSKQPNSNNIQADGPFGAFTLFYLHFWSLYSLYFMYSETYY